MPAYPIWAYYAHGRQRRCQEDSVSLPSGRLEKTTRSSPHHVAQHRPTGSETTPSYAPHSSRFGSEPPSVEDDADVWPETTTRLIAEQLLHGLVVHCQTEIKSHVWLPASAVFSNVTTFNKLPMTRGVFLDFKRDSFSASKCGAKKSWGGQFLAALMPIFPI